MRSTCTTCRLSCLRRGVWNRVLSVEPDQDKADFREMLQGMLDPQLHIAPAIRDRLTQEQFDILFLTGIGEVFPYIRSHNVLATSRGKSSARRSITSPPKGMTRLAQAVVVTLLMQPADDGGGVVVVVEAGPGEWQLAVEWLSGGGHEFTGS